MNERTRGLGRVPSPPDPRDADYPARKLMAAVGTPEAPMKPYRQWYADTVTLDQGPIGQCTTVSLAHILHDGPYTHRPYWTDNKPAYDTVAAYCRAQQIAGQTPTYCQDRVRGDTGTYMRSAALAIRELGYLSAFYWFTNPDAALLYLTNTGPLWLGTWWRAGMDRPQNGIGTYTGARMGGHAFKADEISWKEKFVGFKNSWGTRWGVRGRFRMSFADFRAMLADDGECLAITEQRNP